MGFSNVTLCGNLGKTPELAYSSAGKAWLRARVAVTEWDGEKEVTHWMTVLVFGSRAEHFAKRAQKGSTVVIVGRLKEDHSDDERWDGRLLVVCESFEVVHKWVDARQDQDHGDRVRPEDRGDAYEGGDPDDHANRARYDDDGRVGLEGSAPAGDTRKGRGRGKGGGKRGK